MAAGGNRVLEFLANRPLVICLLYLAAYFTVVPLVVGVIVAYFFRSSKVDDWTRSHYTYAIRTFWFVAAGAVCLLGAVVLMVQDYWWGFLLGIPFLIAIVLGGVRTVLAMINAASEVPMPNPTALII